MRKFTATVACLIFTSSLVACSTMSKPSWHKLYESEEYKAEKKVYSERLGQLEFCWFTGVMDFLNDPSLKPNPNCLYPSSKMEITDNGMFGENRVLGQDLRKLRILQSTNDGFIISGAGDKAILIQKQGFEDLVDGAYIDTQNFFVYQYAGPITYQTLAGSRTVHSFKRPSKSLIEGAQKGLKFYGPVTDLVVESRAWGQLQKPEN